MIISAAGNDATAYLENIEAKVYQGGSEITGDTLDHEQDIKITYSFDIPGNG